MTTLLVIGSFWFWASLIIAFVLLSIYVNQEDSIGFGASAVVIIWLTVFFVFNQDIFNKLLSFIIESPLTFISYILLYLSLGLCWSFYKWYAYLVDYKKTVVKKLADARNPYTYEIPKASKHKDDIILWMCYWVISAYWTLISKWVVKVWYTLYNKFENLYDKMSVNMFKDIK